MGDEITPLIAAETLGINGGVIGHNLVWSVYEEEECQLWIGIKGGNKFFTSIPKHMIQVKSDESSQGGGDDNDDNEPDDPKDGDAARVATQEREGQKVDIRNF